MNQNKLNTINFENYKFSLNLLNIITLILQILIKVDLLMEIHNRGKDLN